MTEQLNCKGKQCPIPVLESKRSLMRMQKGDVLEVLVDGPTQVRNLSAMAKAEGHAAISEKRSETEHLVRITLGEKIAARGCPDGECRGDDSKSGAVVVVIASDAMGGGDDKLGRALMKSFIFALTQEEKLPASILFYNGGVRLTVEGSESLADLKSLEERGVEILSCGTCLNFYNLEGALGVGAVTNMYAIAETQLYASSVLRP